jgi:uncharacterized Fe-S cluster protein YjdI
MKKNITRKYTNGEVTIIWKPDLCTHSGHCVKGLPGVFKPQEQPWINVDNASTEELIDQVKACPSGALSYAMNAEDKPSEEKLEDANLLVELLKDGPFLIHGNIKIKHVDGSETLKSKKTAFCRCGASKNKPFCDGSHRSIEWKE